MDDDDSLLVLNGRFRKICRKRNDCRLEIWGRFASFCGGLRLLCESEAPERWKLRLME